MFWKFNLLNSNIDTLLDKEDVTLQEILDEDDVLQECKAQNRKLIDFLIRMENIEELVNYITQEPSEETDEKSKYKYPNTACELLTSDVVDIYDRLCEETSLMAKVYGFLESEGTLNPLLASFFSKVMGLLINRKSEMIVKYLQSKEDFVGQMLHHISTSAIKDLVLRLISCITTPETRLICINWLNEQQLIQKLINQIHPSHNEESNSNAAQALCDIIRLSKQRMTQTSEDSEEDPLLATIQSTETMTLLLDNMFTGEKTDSVIACGLSVLQTSLEFKRHNELLECGPDQLTPADTERLAQGVTNTLAAITPRLKDMHEILLNPPKQYYCTMVTTCGKLDPPLGNTRLQIARLIATMLLTNSADTQQELAKLGTINVLLDLYFHFIWNNFLHTQVELCLATCLAYGLPEPEKEADIAHCEATPEDVEEGTKETTVESTSSASPILPQLMENGHLLRRVMEAWEDNDVQQSRPGGHRRGYMGHLTRIANHVVETMEKGKHLKELYLELTDDVREKWDNFTTHTLAEVNKINTVELVGTQLHLLHSSSEDDDPDFNNIPFPQDSAMQQAFHDYQLQPMTSTFVDQFGFNEDEFAEQEERVEAPFTDRISSINFDISTTEDNAQAATLFEQACNERMQQFDDPDSDEDLWEEKEITFADSSGPTSQSKPSKPVVRREADAVCHSDDSEGSTESDEELDSPPVIRQTPATAPSTSPHSTTENMDIDSSEWTANFDDAVESSTTPVAMDTSPWDTTSTSVTTTTTTSPPQPESTSNPHTSSDNANAGWANFDSIGSSEKKDEKQEGWADFSSFSEIDTTTLNSSDPGHQRSSSPTAMDTADSNSNPSTNPGSKYLVSSAPADLATEVADAVSSSTDPIRGDGQLDNATTTTNSHSSIDDSISSSTGNGTDNSGNRSPNSNSTSNTDTDVPHSTEPDASCPPPLPETPPPSTLTNHQPCPASPHDHQDNLEEEEEFDDDLSDNFNFLASAGLMRSPDKAAAAAAESSSNSTNNEDSSSPSSSPSQPTAENMTDVEKARAAAKKALEDFDTKANTTKSNGPV